MGWFRDSGEAWSYDHEGFIVAVEKVDGRWREITPADAHRGEIDVVAMLKRRFRDTPR